MIEQRVKSGDLTDKEASEMMAKLGFPSPQVNIKNIINALSTQT